MKKIPGLLLIALLVAGLCACRAANVPAPGAIAATPSLANLPTASAAPTKPQGTVKFADPALEAAVRAALGIPEGEITVSAVEAVTHLNLSNEMGSYLSPASKITDISGLESFTNLENLDLSFHAVSDISALAGLSKLTTLSLSANPLANLAALSRLTGLRALNLSHCPVQDYRPLASLTRLEFLKLDHSSISDVSALATLTNLKYLFLAQSPIGDYSPLAKVYPTLIEKDFLIPSTLEELGFTMDSNSKQAWIDLDDASIRINHITWGQPPSDGDRNCIWVITQSDESSKLAVGFYPELDAYVFQLFKNGEMRLNYIYDPANGGFMFGSGDRESSEQVLRAALPDVKATDLLLAPISLFNETIQNAFSMNANALYQLPFSPITLIGLGFHPDQAQAVCRYEERGERDYNIEVHRPEWGEKEFDIRFFTPLSAEYRIVITYNIAEKKFIVGVDDNYGGGASFEYDAETQAHIDGWCSDSNLSVEEYMRKAYNDPTVMDVYSHSVNLMVQYFQDRFGLTLEEIFELPVGG